MAKYPLEVEIYRADFTYPEPTSNIEQHIVSGRKSEDDEEFDFYVIDPKNGNELGIYGSLVDAMLQNDSESYYYLNQIISGDE